MSLTPEDVLAAAEHVRNVYWTGELNVLKPLRAPERLTGLLPSCHRCGFSIPDDPALCSRGDCPYRPLATQDAHIR